MPKPCLTLAIRTAVAPGPFASYPLNTGFT
jgi:hypothetical protein